MHPSTFVVYNNIYMEEMIPILKKIREKRVTVTNENLEIYGEYRHKITFYQFFLSTDDNIFNG